MSSLLITASPVSISILNQEGKILQLYPSFNLEFVEAVDNYQKDHNIVTDSSKVRNYLKDNEINIQVDIDNPILKDWRMNKFEKNLNETGMVSSYEDYKSKLKNASMQESFNKIKAHAAQKDELIAQVVHSIDDLQKSMNLAGNRLSELYSLHFPELVNNVNNIMTIARLVSTQPQRKDLKQEQLEALSLPKDKVKLIMEKKDRSMGGDLDLDDLVPMQEYAKSLIQMFERKQELERWIDTHMEIIAPNLTAVAGANVGARLISAMGSLSSLAKTYSSKVQVIGAEKALYSALRGRGSPPKHGIIFQIPEIGNAPYWMRGKLARAFASKIVIAARLDEFDGEFLGDQMREELRELEKELREEGDE